MDARYLEGPPDPTVFQPRYSLANQLYVEPEPRLTDSPEALSRLVTMTSQEVAVALSHIEAWKLIADSSVQYALVLEDDVYFARGCVRTMNEAWAHLERRNTVLGSADLIYLSFQEAKRHNTGRPPSTVLSRPEHGLWHASGYVLSKAGARKLLDLLPAWGPIDMWLNHQFHRRSSSDQAPGHQAASGSPFNKRLLRASGPVSGRGLHEREARPVQRPFAPRACLLHRRAWIRTIGTRDGTVDAWLSML